MVSLNGTNVTFLRSKNALPTYSSRRGYQFRSAATDHVEALSARFFTFLWLVTYLCRFRRNIEFIMSYMCHRQAMTYCARSLEFIAKGKINDDLGCFSFDFGYGW